ncbi:unnamed protein product, partial [marine sediment metagenome]
FTIGSQTTTATTDASGVASTTLILDQIAGVYPGKASFAGDDYHIDSFFDITFEIELEDTTLTYTGDLSGQYSDSVTVSATLVEDASEPLPIGWDQSECESAPYNGYWLPKNDGTGESGCWFKNTHTFDYSEPLSNQPLTSCTSACEAVGLECDSSNWNDDATGSVATAVGWEWYAEHAMYTTTKEWAPGIWPDCWCHSGWGCGHRYYRRAEGVTQNCDATS